MRGAAPTSGERHQPRRCVDPAQGCPRFAATGAGGGPIGRGVAGAHGDAAQHPRAPGAARPRRARHRAASADQREGVVARPAGSTSASAAASRRSRSWPRSPRASSPSRPTPDRGATNSNVDLRPAVTLVSAWVSQVARTSASTPRSWRRVPTWWRSWLRDPDARLAPRLARRAARRGTQPSDGRTCGAHLRAATACVWSTSRTSSTGAQMSGRGLVSSRTRRQRASKTAIGSAARAA